MNTIESPEQRASDNHRTDNIALAHEATLAEDPPRTEAKKLWDMYYEGISDTDELAYLTEAENLPEKATEKIREAEEIGSRILRKGVVGRGIINNRTDDVELSWQAALGEDPHITKAQEYEKNAAERKEMGDIEGSELYSQYASVHRKTASATGRKILEQQGQ